MKKVLLNPLTAIITLILLISIKISNPVFLESITLRYFDTVITSTPPKEEPANIYTVNIDDASIDKIGKWPIPRKDYAKIIKELYDKGAGLVVLNILMADKDQANGDLILAKTMQEYPVVLSSIPGETNKNTARNPGSAVIGPQWLDVIIQYPGIVANVEILEKVAAGIGITNTLPEIDGVTRRLPLVVSINEKLYPSLAIETLRVAAGDSTFQVKLNEFGIEKMRIPKFGPITTDNLGRIWIDWQQKSKTVSLTNLPDDFQGAIVIVGVTASGLGNPVATALGGQWPHQLQASVIGTMINGVNIQRPDWAPGAEIIAIVVLSLLLILLTRWTYAGIIFMVGSIGGVVYSSFYFYSNYMYLIDSVSIAVILAIVGFHCYVIKFVNEFLQKQQIKKQFGTYLSPAMVEKLQKNPELLQLGGESRELSIMFTDVRGFTSISEHYGKDVQGLTKIMNRYMTAMTAKIIDNNGTLDKYIGDAQMAFWNAPLDDEKHAIHAVKTAMEMLGDLDAFNREIQSEGVPAFGMGLGINTDVVVVGNMGSDQRFDYTCLGDGVNLASRLEGQSKPYGVKIVIGQRTAELVKDTFFVLELDKIAVKGKKEGVHIYTVLDAEPNAMAEYFMAQTEHDRMLQMYRLQDFSAAAKMCQGLIGEFDGHMDGYYTAWIDRCKEMKRKKLNTDWDGTYVATSK
jgi:adenylate cyclase